MVFKGMMLLAGIFLTMVSCDQKNDSSDPGKGTVLVRVTDSPFPVSAVSKVMVTVDKVEIRSVDSLNVDAENGGFIMLSEKVQEFDILKLRNGLTSDLVQVEVGIGTYDMIRLHVVSSKVVLKDGTEFNLKIPGGSSSGLKIKLNPELVVESGVVNEVLVDFDLSKSFVCLGNHKLPNGIKGFIFKPVVRAMCQKHAGVIEGLALEDDVTPVTEASVQIYRADTVFVTAITDDLGHYKLIGIPAGTYTMSCTKAGYDSVDVDQVVVKVGEKTMQDFMLTKTDASIVLNP